MKIIIIGSGPSGLMCAFKASENGNEVTVIEKNEKPGKKIYLTGKGRCNFTNVCSNQEFFNNIIRNKDFLRSSYNKFDNTETLNFFKSQNMDYVIERGKRAFPKSYHASDVTKALFEACIKNKVEFIFNCEVKNIIKDKDEFVIITENGKYKADKVVVATGGLSYEQTGSTGDGYKFAKAFNHDIIETKPALVSLKIKEHIPHCLNDFTLENVTLTATSDHFKHSEFGDFTFYDNCIAGPIVLTMSSLINRLKDPISLSLDLKPALSIEQLDNKIIRYMSEDSKLTIKNLLPKLFPNEFAIMFSQVLNLNIGKRLRDFSKSERRKLIESIKDFKLTYLSLDSYDRAIITSGGVSVNEIDQKTMESKKIKNLYFIGEVLDIDALTGGFNMQIAFTTGAVCGENL